MAKLVKFPKDFLWGSAASSFQIEGAWREDGKSISNWDVFCKVPGKIKGGDDAHIAIDHYHRYKSDVAMMADLGMQSYRLSVAWPRVIPGGVGKVNAKGLDFYDRLIDELLKHDIRPFVNLFHWDMPNVLEQRGGWRSKAVVQAFADYAGVVADRLSDRVRDWTTFNEIKHIYEGCYQNGFNAPGLNLSARTNNQVLHNVHLAHGMATQALRAAARKPIEVGLVHAFWLRTPLDENNPKDCKAAERCFLDKSGLLFDPIYKGRYPDNAWKPGEEPRITDAEMKIISTPLDFFGLNCYGGYPVAYDSKLGYREVPPHEAPRTTMGWSITPTSMYWAIKHVWDNYPVKKMYVTENGCAFVDVMTHDGKIHDSDRIGFLSSYIGQMQRAMQEGYAVDGYFLWSFFDNFEWTSGYSQRFGIVYVDYPTLKRTPKDSAYWYRDLIRRNAIEMPKSPRPKASAAAPSDAFTPGEAKKTRAKKALRKR